jgi:hypothetical protein
MTTSTQFTAMPILHGSKFTAFRTGRRSFPVVDLDARNACDLTGGEAAKRGGSEPEMFNIKSISRTVSLIARMMAADPAQRAKQTHGQ